MEYTIRLRHDVGSSDSWDTRRAAAAFNLPGPRIEPKYGHLCVCVCLCVQQDLGWFRMHSNVGIFILLTCRSSMLFNTAHILPSLYLSEGFLHIQNLVGKAIVRWRAQVEGVPFPDVDVSVRVSAPVTYHDKFIVTCSQYHLPCMFVFQFSVYYHSHSNYPTPSTPRTCICLLLATSSPSFW